MLFSPGTNPSSNQFAPFCLFKIQPFGYFYSILLCLFRLEYWCYKKGLFLLFEFYILVFQVCCCLLLLVCDCQSLSASMLVVFLTDLILEMSCIDDYTDREFFSHFGVAKQTVLILYTFVQTLNLSYSIGIDKILWMLFFLKVYTSCFESWRLLGIQFCGCFCQILASVSQDLSKVDLEIAICFQQISWYSIY